MIVVGSKCGGYNFWATNNNFSLWLGCHARSDTDIFLKDGEDFPKNCEPHFGVLGIYRGLQSPYFNKRLFMPDKMDYLMLAFERRMLKFGFREKLYQLINRELVFVSDCKRSKFMKIFKPSLVAKIIA